MDVNNIKIGSSNPDVVMFDAPLNRLKTSVFDWYKYANDAGGYWVRGLWLAPVSPWGVYSWPWDLNVPNGALKDVNSGRARWGYVRDGSGKNITSAMTKNFPANVSGNYGVAISVWFNTPNYTDADGNTFLDISDNPIVITFNDGRFDDYTWVMKTGAIAEWSEDKRTITIKRIPFASHVVCQSNNTDKTIGKVREDLYNVYADVSGLSINDGIDFTDETTVECWDAYIGDTQVYHKDRNLENCWDKYGYVAEKTVFWGYDKIPVQEYVIKLPTGKTILPKLNDYSCLANCKFHSISPSNTEVWNDIRDWYKNNTIDGAILAVPSITDGTSMNLSRTFWYCTGFSELTLNLQYQNAYNSGEDNWYGTGIEEITFNTNYSISSPQRWFRGMSKLKTIKYHCESSDYLFGATSTVDMFGGDEALEEYPAKMINWGANVNSTNVTTRRVTLTQYTFAGCRKLKKVPSYVSGDKITCCYLAYMFNNCNALTTIEPILDVVEQTCAPSGADLWFSGCNALTSVKIKGLSHGDWYFDGSTVNNVKHGDLSNLDEASVQYLFANLADLTTCNPKINKKAWYNNFSDWILNQGTYIDESWGELLIPEYVNEDDENPTMYNGVIASVSGIATPAGCKIKLAEAATVEGYLEIVFSDNSKITVDIDSSADYYIIPTGVTGLTINAYDCVVPCDFYIAIETWDSSNPLVNSATLNCPSAWSDKVTSSMVSSAKTKGWTITVGGTTM